MAGPWHPRSSSLAGRASGRGAFALTLLIFLLGLSLRIHGLSEKTLSHPEAWVPRIPYPAFVEQLHARRTIREVVDSTAGRDRHPPGYYLAMWVWTRAWGTQLGTIRFPSALAGAALIPLLYCMARLDGRRGAGLIAAALMALHGPHIFWSQHARMWVFLPLLAVASFLLLMRLERAWRAREALAYVLVTSAGLWFQYYFWPVLAAQILWILVTHHDRKRIPASLGLQTIAVILASPVVLFLRTDWRWVDPVRPDAAEPSYTWLLDFLTMGSLLDRPALQDALGAAAPWAWGGVSLLGIGLMVVGVHGRVSRATGPPGGRGRGLPLPIFAVAAATASLFCAVFDPQLRQYVGPRWIAAGVALPWLIVAAWLAVEKLWPTIGRSAGSGRIGKLVQTLRILSADSVTAQLGISLLIFVLLSLSTPMVVSRGMLILTPFLIVLVARGASQLARKSRFVATLVVLPVLIAGITSAAQYKRLPTSPCDYQSMVRAMEPLMSAADAVALDGEWWAQPMHYYLPSDRRTVLDIRQLIGADSQKLAAAHSRIWVVEFRRTPAEELAESLSAYRQVEQVLITTRGWGKTFLCRAVLYEAENSGADD